MINFFQVMLALFARPFTRNTQPSAETLKHQAGGESRNNKNMDIYFKQYIIYRDVKKE